MGTDQFLDDGETQAGALPAAVGLPVRLEDGLEEWELAFATAVRACESR